MIASSIPERQKRCIRVERAHCGCQCVVPASHLSHCSGFGALQKTYQTIHSLANRGSNSLYAFAEPLRCVNEAKASDENKAAFTQFVTDPKNGNLKLNEVTAFLDETFLYDWAVGADLSSVPASVQTLAVGQVYSVSNDKGSVIPDSVAATFNSFEKHSGDRLAVFVWYAPASIDEPRLRDAIERLLQDDEVSTGMYQLALHQRIDFIKNHIDTAKLQLSPAHQQRYDGFRESAGKRNGA